MNFVDVLHGQELEQRRNRTNPTLELLSPGTAWFDLLEVIPDIK